MRLEDIMRLARELPERSVLDELSRSLAAYLQYPDKYTRARLDAHLLLAYVKSVINTLSETEFLNLLKRLKAVENMFKFSLS